MAASRRGGSDLPLVAVLAFLATSLAIAQGTGVPVRTAINRKDAATLATVCMPDAVVIHVDGEHAAGPGGDQQDADGRGGELATDHPLVRYDASVRQYCMDVGSSSTQGSGSDATVSRYLVVLWRGVQDRKISRVAVALEKQLAARALSTPVGARVARCLMVARGHARRQRSGRTRSRCEIAGRHPQMASR
jgi:ketosteroid isomerase-like protein